MKKAILIALALVAASFAALAQNTNEIDSTYANRSTVDSTLVGKNIFNVLGDKNSSASREGKVVIDQTDAVAKAMSNHIARNASRSKTGYRIRIFFDNKQDARAKSEKVAASFKAQHPGIAVYRAYENPYFKVTVGDFRSKEDARKFLNSIKGSYPSGFIVRERINYSVL
ncbi:MAG: SPOR domain-containing protein [Bacteroidales bacterium]|nr:SPOR domain-containing protein [Bacteroidales bacterium]